MFFFVHLKNAENVTAMGKIKMKNYRIFKGSQDIELKKNILFSVRLEGLWETLWLSAISRHPHQKASKGK